MPGVLRETILTMGGLTSDYQVQLVVVCAEWRLTMLRLCAIKGPTGRMLAEMLTERGLLKGRVEGVVNYGYGADQGLPTLNKNAGRLNKYQELVKLDDAGVRTIPFSDAAGDLQVPIFGRNLHHTRGNDIRVYQAQPDAARGVKPPDYYTQIVLKTHEYRVWAYRNKALALYNKQLDYPEKYGRRGRSKDVWNWANGYAYKFLAPGEAVDDAKARALAVKAIAALDLDFGAVDMIGKDGRWYVLEVNTAPGVQDRRQGITSLVNCIERWAKNGFKNRE